MDVHSQEPFWLLKNGLLHSYPSLRQSLSCDVLIIGGGITGALMAHSLVQAGFDTVVIDKRDVATGSTSASTAMLQYEIDTALHELIPMIGEEGAVKAYESCLNAIGEINRIVKALKSRSGFKLKKSLYIAAVPDDEAFLRKEFESRRKHGFNVQWLNRKSLRNRFGLAAVAAICSSEAAEIDAYRFAHELLKASVAKGLRVFDHVEIQSTEYDPNGVRVLTQDLAMIEARNVIYCTGYESQEMLPGKVVDLKSTFAVVSEPLAELPPELRSVLLWDTQDPYLYLRTTDDNRVLVGGGDEPFKNAALRDKLIDQKRQMLTEKVRELYPDLAFVPDLAWAGTFGETKDGLPYIGEHPAFPHSYFALGFGGNGITFSVTAAQLIRDVLRGKKPDELHYYRFGR
ncbi:NAD(P)/FAD-dependent oxidoreductase [Larkinella rosea]|uniref:FAD-binding oxidoreductase n=1 Tax=Larkinella rosea TaxID=2025312 RepID=A0A3P1C335_9BACT|nr:FAD-dependent oxidoreductase [Larkinella rosea]RRB07506.1 FAD-binding oxidoreductase [Larkinella rosea]